MKKYLFGILAITLAVGFSAFTTKKASKPFFTSQTVYLVSGSDNQRVEQGFTGQPTDDENTVTPASFNDINKWTTTSNSRALVDADGDSYMYKFTIENYSTTTDNDDSNGITVAQALSALVSTTLCSPALVSGSPAIFAFPTSTSTTVQVKPSNGVATVTISNFTRADEAF
jgi:lipopolysaccharide export LptBFGC system permease protein LptF